MITIIGIKLQSNHEFSPKFQEILAKYSCSIRSRIGLHETSTFYCSPYGLILLHIINDKVVKDLEKDLCNIEDIEIQTMKFS